MFNILVVEDDKNLRKLITTYLQRNKYNTYEATNGEEALNVLDQSYIDLIVSDIMMPKMDGYELIKVQTPVLLTAIAELNHPRYMNVGKIFATKDKEITVFTANDLDIDASQIGLKGSPTKVKKSMTKEAKGAGEIVKESAPEAVAYVLGKLKEKHYI